MTSSRNGPMRITICAIACATVAASAGACASNSTGQQAPTAAATISPPRQPPDITPELQKQLTDAVARYQQVYSSVYANPRQDLGVVDTVATGQESAGLRDQARQLADQKLAVKGEVKVVRVTVVSVEPNPPNATAPATAVVKDCNDVSSVTAATPDGKSVVDPRRLPQTQERLTFTNPTPADPNAWRLTTAESGVAIPCDPS